MSQAAGKASRAPAASRRLIRAKDLLIAFGLGVMAVVAWLVPERHWHPLARFLVPVSGLGLGSRVGARRLASIRRALGPAFSAEQAEDILRSVAGHLVARQFQLLRCYRPGGWSPAITLRGAEHLDAAIARGRGTVLWVGQFAASDLVVKIALHRHGYRVYHLSNETHGFSRTAFGVHFLNPIRTAVENRFLAGRVILNKARPVVAMRTMQRLLQAAETVSVTAVDNDARRTLVAPFLNGALSVGSGAADLAYATGAVLLPVDTTQKDHIFTVTIGPPLDLPVERPRPEATSVAFRQYASNLEKVVLQFPEQWYGWTRMLSSPPQSNRGRDVS
jgi:lauroyl/myristoyl acyltransferase